MSQAFSFLRPIVALASLSVLIGVDHGPAPSPAGALPHGEAVEAAAPVATGWERGRASAPRPADRDQSGPLPSRGEFFGASLPPGEIGSAVSRLSYIAAGPTEAENAREAGNGLAGAAPAATPGPTPLALPQYRSTEPEGYYDFYFTRAIYGGGGLGGRSFFRSSWAVDFPKADRQFLVVLGETLDLLRVPSVENAVNLADPNLRKYPFLYTLEVGGMYLSQPQVEGLRNYLLAGGFLVVDDFWGAWEWRNFEEQIRRVLPGVEIEEIPLNHEIFHVFYDIEEILQVPNIGNAQRGVTSECGPCQPRVRGIFDDDGRLMVVINWNTDLGDAWEWSEQAAYPFEYSNFAYKMAVNFIVYAMTH